MRTLQVVAAMCLTMSLVAAVSCGLAGEEAPERPQITASEVASLALEFGRQAMQDAQLDMVGTGWDQGQAPLWDGRAEEWDVHLCSPSTGLTASLRVHSGGEIYLDHLQYESLGSLEDIPVAEISPDEAWVEDPVFEPELVARGCKQTVQDWLDSPAVAATAGTSAEEWYRKENEDFDDVYLSSVSLIGEAWEFHFAPHVGGNARRGINVTLDLSGNVLEVKPVTILLE